MLTILKRRLVEMGYQEGFEKGYRKGLEDAIRALAIWHDGAQYVGVSREPLKVVLERVQTLPINQLRAQRW